MTIVLIILGIYIGMVVVSLLGPYVDFKKNHCEKGKKYTLEDLYTARAEQFSGIDNFMYIPSNPAQIEQFLTNFKNMDVFDVYTPLQSIHRSSRYDVVRDNVL